MFEAIDLGDFEKRTGIRGRNYLHAWSDAECIVSLRDFKKVTAVQVMPIDYLTKMLQSVSLAGDLECRLYAKCEIVLARVDPHQVFVGQTFVEKSKIWSLLNEFTNVFKGFCVTRGTAKCGALMALGETHSGVLAIGHYVPPIIEQHAIGTLLLDGLHRSFLQKQIGTTGESVVVRGVERRFPCSVHSWVDVVPVDEKPEKSKRFFDLEPALFRDVKSVGIDG